MKKNNNRLLLVLILMILISGFPTKEAKASNLKSFTLYVGQELAITFNGVGVIQKVTYSNKKVAITKDIGTGTVTFKAKEVGKTTMNVKGTTQTYKIEIVVKKMDVKASFYKKLPDGKYIVKYTNNTKAGFFEDINFKVIYRSSEGEFLDWDENSISWLLPGTSVYDIFQPNDDYDIDLKKSKIEVSDFEIDVDAGKWTKYVDCTSKIRVTDPKGGIISPSDYKFTFKTKNNSSYDANIKVCILWYDANDKLVTVDNIYSYESITDLVYKWTVDIPDEIYGAVSYKISISAHNEINLSDTPSYDNFDIPTF